MISSKYKSHRRRNTNRKLVAGSVFVVFVLLCGAVGGYAYFAKQKSLQIPKNVGFGVWAPKDVYTGSYVLQKNTLQYNNVGSTITFKLKNKKDNNVLTFTEQAVPESFAVAPDAFDRQVASLQQMTKFDSIHGSVALTRPLQGTAITAIMRAQGTLVYVHSEQEISTDAWRALFNDMELIK